MPFSQWIVVPIQNMHVFGIVMAGLGKSQSPKLISVLKKWWNQKAVEGLKDAGNTLLDALEQGLSNKIRIITAKLAKIRRDNEILEYMKKRYEDDRKYFEERKNEIASAKQKDLRNPTDIAINTFDLVRRSKVHPVVFQLPLKDLLKHFDEAKNLIKG